MTQSASCVTSGLVRIKDGRTLRCEFCVSLLVLFVFGVFVCSCRLLCYLFWCCCYLVSVCDFYFFVYVHVCVSACGRVRYFPIFPATVFPFCNYVPGSFSLSFFIFPFFLLNFLFSFFPSPLFIIIVFLLPRPLSLSLSHLNLATSTRL